MRTTAVLVALLAQLFVFYGAAFAQTDAGPITVDSRSTVPVILEMTIPTASGVQTVTVTVAVDVQSIVTLDPTNPTTATVVLRATPKSQSGGDEVQIAGVSVGAIQSGTPKVRAAAVETTGLGALLPIPTPTREPVAAETVENGAYTSSTPDEMATSVNASANLRSGPGIDYDIVARAETGELVTVTGRTESGEWLQLAGGAWIAAFLLQSIPESVAIVNDIPPLPTVAPASTTANWRSYRLISGDAAFSYPPDREITDEDSDSATLDPTDGGPDSIVVTGSTTVIDFTDTAGATRILKSELTDISDFNFRFLDEGTLALPGNPVYVVASAEYEGSTVGFVSVMVPVGSRTVTMLYFRVNQADVSAKALPLLTAMADTLTP